ncbi:hypothetical protein AVEN_88272-1 [Araneus ventricosus]|uniref:Uncharacterized protein n=1 Tax=Araneus ventricosus TaxID=182803 RepID=A0A4Y2ENF4_ARAVE|nr:hypothetical protein AVEN_88272-1 [Araneus ventricosus]
MKHKIKTSVIAKRFDYQESSTAKVTLTEKIEIFFILVDEFSSILFIEGCRQLVQIDVLDVLKFFDSAEALSSQTCLQLSKKVKITSVSL